MVRSTHMVATKLIVSVMSCLSGVEREGGNPTAIYKVYTFHRTNISNFMREKQHKCRSREHVKRIMSSLVDFLPSVYMLCGLLTTLCARHLAPLSAAQGSRTANQPKRCAGISLIRGYVFFGSEPTGHADVSSLLMF